MTIKVQGVVEEEVKEHEGHPCGYDEKPIFIIAIMVVGYAIMKIGETLNI